MYHDLLGMLQHPHHAKVGHLLCHGSFSTLQASQYATSCSWTQCTFLQVTPKFCKQYAQVGSVIQDALGQYRAEVLPACACEQQCYRAVWATHADALPRLGLVADANCHCSMMH